MKLSDLQFVRPLAFLACLALILGFAPQWASAQQQQPGGGTNTGGNTGGGTTGGGTTGGGTGTGDGALDFDAGVNLERTERVGRDTGTFVGAQAPTVGNFAAVNDATGGLGGVGGNQLGQQFNLLNQLNRANQFNQQNQQQSKIRIPLRLGFAKPQNATTNPQIARQVGSTLSVRFSQIDRFARPIQVDMNGGTAVLTGTVADAETRRLAERLAMLEPGVVSVQNELEIIAAANPELIPTPAGQP